nr:hypothetical protein KUHPSE03_p1370 [Staphylococcus epidermidis]
MMAEDKFEQGKGNIKETVGNATNNENLKQEGKKDKASSKVKEYKNHGNLSSIVMGASAISLLFLVIIKLTFEWSFLDCFANFFKGTFILGTVIDAIPDFLEKNVKRIIWNLIFILIMILILFVF